MKDQKESMVWNRGGSLMMKDNRNKLKMSMNTVNQKILTITFKCMKSGLIILPQ